MSGFYAITIARQFGSGGGAIAEKVGEKLGYKVFDRELISLAAEKSGLNPNMLHRADEKAANSLLYSIAVGTAVYNAGKNTIDLPINDKLYIAQSEIINEIAGSQNCVIIGRCGDFVLRNHQRRISIFIYSSLPERIKRVCEKYELNENDAENLIAMNDKKRVNYYNFYTGKKWGAVENYNLCLDVSCLGEDEAAEYIKDFILKVQKKMNMGSV